MTVFDAFNEGIRRICPMCIEEFYPGDCRIVSGVSGKELKAVPTSWWERQRARRNPEPLLGHRHVRELARRECPNPNCRYLLPYNIESVESKSVVVVGDTNAGKSHYLAALIRQIHEGQVQNLNQSVQFVPLTKDVLDKYSKEYIDELFNKRQSLPPTQRAIATALNKPLIYEVTIKKSEAHPARRINLILYDASGEDYNDPQRLVIYSPYVLNASAIIFLADPVSMPNIFSRLPAHLQPQVGTGRRASDVLNLILQLFQQNLGVQAGSRLVRTPLAITLSKSDLLKYLRGISEPYRFMTDPAYAYTGGVDLQDLQIVDQEVRKLIDEFGDRMLMQAARSLNVHFFASSATGHAPSPIFVQIGASNVKPG